MPVLGITGAAGQVLAMRGQPCKGPVLGLQTDLCLIPAAPLVCAAGEMRALHPGSGSRRQQIAGSCTSDFYGPAMIGLSSLFSMLHSSGSEGGGKDGSDGSANSGGGSSGSGSKRGGSVGSKGDDGKRSGRSGSTRGRSMRCSIGGSKDGGSTGSSSSESEVESASDDELDYHWQQEALALTHCHLWRIDCQQLYKSLREPQPGVLLYMLRRLLQSLGVPQAATNGAGVPEEPPPPPAAPARAGSRRLALVQRLLAICRELEAAEREQPGASASHEASKQQLPPSWRTDTLTSTSDSLRASFGPRGSLELESVDVEEEGGHLTADVLHTGE